MFARVFLAAALAGCSTNHKDVAPQGAPVDDGAAPAPSSDAAVAAAPTPALADAATAAPPTRPPTQPQGPRTMRSDIGSRLEAARKLAGGGDVQAYQLNDIDGIAIVLVASGTPGKTDRDGRFGRVLVDGGHELLAERKAMREVVARTQDPVSLAYASLLLLEGYAYAEPIVDPGGAGAPREVAPLVTRPAIAGDVLEFWAWTGAPGRTLARRRIDLRSLKVDRASGSSLVKAALGPLAAIRKNINATSQSVQRRAIEDLARDCDKLDGARELMLETMKSHPSAFARIEAGKKIRGCHPPDAASTLIEILEHDTSDDVRMWAAAALGDLGDPAARAALEAATQTRHRGLKSAATSALKKLH